MLLVILQILIGVSIIGLALLALELRRVRARLDAHIADTRSTLQALARSLGALSVATGSPPPPDAAHEWVADEGDNRVLD